MKMVVLAGDLRDPSNSGPTFTITVPPEYENRLNKIRPRPNGSWYDADTGEVVATGCLVAGGDDARSNT